MIGIGKKDSKISSQAGTTIFELVVAMSIFTILILSMTAIYQLVYQAQRNAIDARNTQESMRYVMEVFSKELRSAQRDSGACANGEIYDTSGSIINFKNYHNQCVRYYLSGNSLMVRRDSVTATATPNEIKISNLQFILGYGTDQARVTMKADAEVLYRTSNKQQLKIQTTVSSRFYD